jgi:hypothetical protein
MSVGTVTIQLPSRACWWIKALAEEARVSVRTYLQVMVLRQLAELPGVDLSRSPGIALKGGRNDGSKERAGRKERVSGGRKDG